MIEEPLPRPGPWTSKQLGIPYPYIGKIYIGVCGSKDPNHGSQSPWNEEVDGGAHAHSCPKDPANGLVCFHRLDYLYAWYDSDQASATFWHEYAHLLENGEEFACPHNKEDFVANFNAIQKTGHGDRWKTIMRNLRQYVPHYYFDSYAECEDFNFVRGSGTFELKLRTR